MAGPVDVESTLSLRSGLLGRRNSLVSALTVETGATNSSTDEAAAGKVFQQTDLKRTSIESSCSTATSTVPTQASSAPTAEIRPLPESENGDGDGDEDDCGKASRAEICVHARGPYPQFSGWQRKGASIPSQLLALCKLAYVTLLLARLFRRLFTSARSVIEIRVQKDPKELSQPNAQRRASAPALTERRLMAIKRGDVFEAAFVRAIHNGSLKPPVVRECISLPVGQKLKEVFDLAVRGCRGLETADPMGHLDGILIEARKAATQLVPIMEDYCHTIATVLKTGASLDGLVPKDISCCNLTHLGYDPKLMRAASGVGSVVLFALLVLRNMCVGLSRRAMDVGEQYIGADIVPSNRVKPTEITARSRAVKRDICLLRGTYTHLIVQPLFEPLAILRAHVA